MSDEYAIRPTDEELAGWADPEGEAGLYFPEYYVERHYELLQGMFEELIESRAVIAESTERWADLTQRVAHLGNNLDVARAGRWNAEARVTELEERITNARNILGETGRYNAARTKHWNIRVFACDVLAALRGAT